MDDGNYRTMKIVEVKWKNRYEQVKEQEEKQWTSLEYTIVTIVLHQNKSRLTPGGQKNRCVAHSFPGQSQEKLKKKD